MAAARVGSASVAAPAGMPARASAGSGPDGDGVPLRGEDGRSSGAARAPVVGAKAAAAKAAGIAGAAGPGEDEPDDEPGRGGLRQQLRSRRKLVLLSLAVVVLVVLPAFFGLRAASSDPVFGSLDSLDVPTWATQKVDDQSSGSRWCFIDCTFRERTAESQRPIPETTAAYTSALTSAGWSPWKVADCPEEPLKTGDGTYTCWKRDEFTLDLRVGRPKCEVDQIAANDPALAGSTAPPVTPPGQCVGSSVSIKVWHAIADTRGKPDPQKSPLVGETPDAPIPDDPLLTPTPSAS
ncbi:hypothetical protein [Actinoplanes sp. M2I2]|uniref:hypothetical protein n=1 Tax=Actinoplanes sp. M2I2 TaxID=1734444 RepID=UPI002020E75E|nr:hypothetical protein [Actinoplanes sp. M2I2]